MAIRLRDTHIRAFDAVHRDIWGKSPHGEYWLCGGRGSTKSSYISLEIVSALLRDENYNVLCLRRLGNTLRDSCYQQVLWAIDKLGLSAYFTAKKAPPEIVYNPTGQRILFRGADDPLKLKSIKLHRGYFRFVWFEELAEFRSMEDVRSILQSVLRGEGAGTVFMSYNPPRSMTAWVNQEVLRQDPSRMVSKTTYLDVPREWLGADFLHRAEMLKEHNPIAYRNEYLGEITGSGGRVFRNVRLEKGEATGKIYCGLDFGFACDPDALVVWAYDKKRRVLTAVDEFSQTNVALDTLAQRVKEACGSEIVTCDCADPRMIAELKKRGIAAVAAKKGRGSVEHGIRCLQDMAEIVINPKKTPCIAREFASYEYERDKTGAFLSSFPDRDNHTIDATRYALERVPGAREAKTLPV